MYDLQLNIKKTGHGKPLVLLHGWGFDLRVWDSLTDLLNRSGDYELYQVDLPGFGHSNMMDFATFKQLLLDQIPEQATVIGWSMGGLYATRLAIEAPARIQRLINVASSPCFVINPDWPGISAEVLSAFYRRLSANPAGILNNFVQMQLNGCEIPGAMNFIDNLSPVVPDGLRTGLDILSQWDLRADLHALRLPVFYLFGRRDMIVPHATMVAMERDYPQFTHKLFNDAAHMPFLSHTDEFVTLLQEWMQC